MFITTTRCLFFCSVCLFVCPVYVRVTNRSGTSGVSRHGRGPRLLLAEAKSQPEHIAVAVLLGADEPWHRKYRWVVCVCVCFALYIGGVLFVWLAKSLDSIIYLYYVRCGGFAIDKNVWLNFALASLALLFYVLRDFVVGVCKVHQRKHMCVPTYWQFILCSFYTYTTISCYPFSNLNIKYKMCTCFACTHFKSNSYDTFCVHLRQAYIFLFIASEANIATLRRCLSLWESTNIRVRVAETQWHTVAACCIRKYLYLFSYVFLTILCNVGNAISVWQVAGRQCLLLLLSTVKHTHTHSNTPVTCVRFSKSLKRG